MALCTCASMVLGLMTTPQSTAQVTRLTATLPSMETRRQDLASTPETCRKPRLADAACDGVALRQGMTIDNSTPTLGLRRVSAGDALLKRHGLPGVITTCLQAPRRVCAS